VSNSPGRRTGAATRLAGLVARLVGHVDTTTTETVYRKQIRPVVLDGATAMDRIFPEDEDA
jgi:integrase